MTSGVVPAACSAGWALVQVPLPGLVAATPWGEDCGWAADSASNSSTVIQADLIVRRNLQARSAHGPLRTNGKQQRQLATTGPTGGARADRTYTGGTGPTTGTRLA